MAQWRSGAVAQWLTLHPTLSLPVAPFTPFATSLQVVRKVAKRSGLLGAAYDPLTAAQFATELDEWFRSEGYMFSKIVGVTSAPSYASGEHHHHHHHHQNSPGLSAKGVGDPPR